MYSQQNVERECILFKLSLSAVGARLRSRYCRGLQTKFKLISIVDWK